MEKKIEQSHFLYWTAFFLELGGGTPQPHSRVHVNQQKNIQYSHLVQRLTPYTSLATSYRSRSEPRWKHCIFTRTSLKKRHGTLLTPLSYHQLPKRPAAPKLAAKHACLA
jgi:hypothetical protein